MEAVWNRKRSSSAQPNTAGGPPYPPVLTSPAWLLTAAKIAARSSALFSHCLSPLTGSLCTVLVSTAADMHNWPLQNLIFSLFAPNLTFLLHETVSFHTCIIINVSYYFLIYWKLLFSREIAKANKRQFYWLKIITFCKLSGSSSKSIIFEWIRYTKYSFISTTSWYQCFLPERWNK